MVYVTLKAVAWKRGLWNSRQPVMENGIIKHDIELQCDSDA